MARIFNVGDVVRCPYRDSLRFENEKSFNCEKGDCMLWVWSVANVSGYCGACGDITTNVQNSSVITEGEPV